MVYNAPAWLRMWGGEIIVRLSIMLCCGGVLDKCAGFVSYLVLGKGEQKKKFVFEEGGCALWRRFLKNRKKPEVGGGGRRGGGKFGKTRW